ncbi:MAG: type IV pilus assembly protein PilM [Chryseobacterium sp.]|nr:MAG: type IV pilus assembly protein PilM [Chryseobacterium sp.]
METFDQEQNYFGLDLGNSSIKVAQLRELHGRPTLVTYGDMDIPENVLASDSQIDQDRIAEFVRQLASDAGVSSKNVIAALPSSSSFTAIIKTPKLNEKELGESISYQADKYIPMPIDQVKLDWAVIGDNADSDELDVLLAAAPNNIAQKYLNIVQKAGFELLALEINALALARSLTVPTQTSATVMIVDIGTLASDIAIFTGQIPQIVRSVGVGSKALRRVISQNLGLDETQSDQFMKKFGMQQDKIEGQVYKTLKPVVDHIVEEINKSIQFNKERSQDSNIEKIILTGGTSALPGLAVYVANATQITVEIGNPWMNISYPTDIQQNLAGISLNYATVLGLALRNFTK